MTQKAISFDPRVDELEDVLQMLIEAVAAYGLTDEDDEALEIRGRMFSVATAARHYLTDRKAATR